MVEFFTTLRVLDPWAQFTILFVIAGLISHVAIILVAIVLGYGDLMKMLKDLRNEEVNEADDGRVE
jgi:hypothetical protein